MMATEDSSTRQDALARATALVSRARGLRRAQSEVQDMTAREVALLASTAAQFFDSIPMVEFTTALLPSSARALRRVRHRVIHSVVEESGSGVLVRVLLLGRDGALRLFSVRSEESRDLLHILEPGRIAPVGVMRDVVEWTPAMRIPDFRPFEILDKLAQSLDAVEEQIAEAEERVQVQKSALETGNLSALLPVVRTPGGEGGGPLRRWRSRPAEPASPDDPRDLFTQVEALSNGAGVVSGDAEATAASGRITDAHADASEWAEPDESVRHPESPSA
jgi:hypothetical protein